MKRLIFLALAAAGGWSALKLLGKKNEFLSFSENFKIKPSLPKKVQTTGTGVSITTDVVIQNQSDKDFSVSGLGLVSLKKLFLLQPSTGNVIAEATTEVNNISIPPGGEVKLENVLFNADFASIGQNIIPIISGTFQFAFAAEISVLGRKFLV